MKTLKARLVRKEVKYKGKKWNSFYIKFINKNGETDYMDATVCDEALDTFNDNEDKESLDLVLNIGSKDEKGKNAFIAPKSKQQEDGSYKDILDSKGNRIPKIVIQTIQGTDILKEKLVFPVKTFTFSEDDLPF